MPRRPRAFIEGGVYHVYNRFARGAEIFCESGEGKRFTNLLRDARNRDGLTVFAWCLMSNHYHLAVRTGPVPLWRTVGTVQARFGRDYNRRHASKGPLWQSRYNARLVEDQHYLDRLIAYIHLNPVSAGLVTDPANYPFSGHNEVLGSNTGSLVDADSVLAAFGGTARTARRRYVGALLGARDEAWRTELPGRLPWWGREPDRPVKPATPSAWVDELGRSTGLERSQVAARSFLEAACRALAVTPHQLASHSSERSLTRLRSMVVALGAERWGQGTKRLADLLGRRADVVSRWVRWGGERRQTDEAFRLDFEALDESLATALKRKTRTNLGNAKVSALAPER